MFPGIVIVLSGVVVQLLITMQLCPQVQFLFGSFLPTFFSCLVECGKAIFDVFIELTILRFSIGYPVVTLGYGVKSYVGYKIRQVGKMHGLIPQ